MKKLFYTALVAVAILTTSCGSKSSKIDAALDTYEKAVDAYIEAVQKGGSADMSDAVELSTKAADAASKIDDLKEDMTDAQIQRLQRITAKSTSAAMNAAGASMEIPSFGK